MKFYIRKSAIENLLQKFGFVAKSADIKESKLDQLKKEVIAVIKKKFLDSPKGIEDGVKHLAKSLDGTWVEKSGYPLGTVRIWKGKKYKKTAPNRWTRLYESGDKGANVSIGRYIAQVKKCTSEEELLAFCLKEKSIFKDENGVDLPIVEKLRKAVEEKKASIASGAGKPAEMNSADKNYIAGASDEKLKKQVTDAISKYGAIGQNLMNVLYNKDKDLYNKLDKMGVSNAVQFINQINADNNKPAEKKEENKESENDIDAYAPGNDGDPTNDIPFMLRNENQSYETREGEKYKVIGKDLKGNRIIERTSPSGKKSKWIAEIKTIKGGKPDKVNVSEYDEEKAKNEKMEELKAELKTVYDKQVKEFDKIKNEQNSEKTQKLADSLQELKRYYSNRFNEIDRINKVQSDISKLDSLIEDVKNIKESESKSYKVGDSFKYKDRVYKITELKDGMFTAESKKDEAGTIPTIKSDVSKLDKVEKLNVEQKESEAEKHANRSDAMKGNDNAYKGGKDDEPIHNKVSKKGKYYEFDGFAHNTTSLFTQSKNISESVRNNINESVKEFIDYVDNHIPANYKKVAQDMIDNYDKYKNMQREDFENETGISLDEIKDVLEAKKYIRFAEKLRNFSLEGTMVSRAAEEDFDEVVMPGKLQRAIENGILPDQIQVIEDSKSKQPKKESSKKSSNNALGGNK